MGVNLHRLVSGMAAIIMIAGTTALSACSPRYENLQVGLLIAASDSARGAAFDRAVRDRINEECGGCTVTSYDAKGDATVQVEQAQQAVEQGASVLIVVPVDADNAATIVTVAGDVPVVAVDETIAGAAATVGPDASQVAELVSDHARELAGKHGKVLTLTPLSGSDDALVSDLGPAMSRASLLSVGALMASTSQDETVRAWLTTQLDRYAGAQSGGQGNGRRSKQSPVVVVALTPHLADVASREMKARTGVALIGIGTNLDAVHRMIRGNQAALIGSSTPELVTVTADTALALANGDEPPTTMASAKLVTLDWLGDQIVRDGTMTWRQVCTSVLKLCAKLGLH